MNLPFHNSSLYVGDLLPDITEAVLYEYFNPVGLVTTIRVCRDNSTRRSLGYAYVNFQNPQDAERALEALNFAPIRGKPCRVMWSQRDPALRKSGVGNIFIKNLDKSVDNKALYDTFSAFGNILSCKVNTDENGNSKGFGFVHFETQAAADKAVGSVNGMLIVDKKVYVGPFIPRKVRNLSYGQDIKFTNVFIKNLDDNVDDAKLFEMFSVYGDIVSAVVMRDMHSGKSKGFGFVCFRDHEAAKDAVDNMHEKNLDGKTLYCARAQKKAEREAELRNMYENRKAERQKMYQGVNLYVKNLDETVDDEKLRQEFSAYGNITSCRVMRDEKNLSKGFGFVCFSNPDEATKALVEMNNRMFGNKPLYVALHQRKEVRRAQLEIQHGFRPQRMDSNFMPGPPMYAGAPPGMFFPGQNMPQRTVYPYNGPMVRYRQMPPVANRTVPASGNFQAAPMNYNGAPAGRGRARPQRMPAQGGPLMKTTGERQPRPAGAPNTRGFKFGPNVRNREANPGMQGALPSMPQVGAIPETITLQSLANASEAEQKRIIGERLYSSIFAHQPEAASKITGMLLEMDNSELILLLESPEALLGKINEAVNVLQQVQSS